LSKDKCDTTKTNKSGCPPNDPCKLAYKQMAERMKEAESNAKKLASGGSLKTPKS